MFRYHISTCSRPTYQYQEMVLRNLKKTSSLFVFLIKYFSHERSFFTTCEGFIGMAPDIAIPCDMYELSLAEMNLYC